MKYRILTALGLTSLLLTGCASTPDKAPSSMAMDKTPTATQSPAPAISDSETVTLTATVKAIDLNNRLVTLKPKKGEPFTIHVGEQARNLPQLRVGDRVTVRYTEAVAVKINRDTSKGITSRRETLSGSRTELGQRPGGTLQNTVEIIANVLAIDPQTRKITFQGPERALIVKVPADVNISRLDVGDQVLLTYTEELAISVEPASTKPATPAPGFKNKRS